VAIGFQHLFGFTAEIKGFGRFRLHAEGQFKRLDAGLQLRVVQAGSLMLPVELLQ
jgi:hypothetical protein